MVHSVHGALSPWWSSVCGPWAAALLPVDKQGQLAAGNVIFGYLLRLGVVVPLVSLTYSVLCTRVQDPGHPESHGWSVGCTAEMAEPLPRGSRCCARGDLGASFSWWHQEATTCQGWAFPAIPYRPHRQTAGGSPAHPGPPGEPITPPCSSSSPSKAVLEEGENPALQLLPSAAGMWEGAEPPAQQLKITKYFPNIIRFPCKQLP